jgi:hypothetical protein
MGNEREFKIKITGDASGLATSAEQGRNSLGQFTKTTQESGHASEAAGAATESHSKHLHGLHKICHALNEVLPGLGTLMQAAFTPVGAAISVAVMALRYFHEKLKETNEEFKRMEEEAAKPLTRRMEAMREAVVATAAGMAGLRDKLAEAARGEQTLKEQTEKAIAVSRQQSTEAQSLAGATENNELARLDLLHAAGLMSEQKYADERLAIELEYRKKKQQIDEREEMTAILMKRRQLESAQASQPEIVKAAETAEVKKEKALENVAALRSRADIEEDKKKAEQALKDWDEKHGKSLAGAQANVDRDVRLGYGNPGATAEETYGLNLDRARLAPLQAEREKLQAAAELARKQWQQAPAAEARKKVEADAATREADRAARRAEQNQTFITDTGRDVEAQQATFEARKGAAAQRNALEADTLQKQELASSPIGKLIGSVAGSEHTLQTGGRISAAEQVQINVLNQLLAQTGRANPMTVETLGKLVGKTEQLFEAMSAMSKRLDGIKLQSKNTFNQ